MRKKKKKKKKELMVLGSQYSSIAGFQRQIYVQSEKREKMSRGNVLRKTKIRGR